MPCYRVLLWPGFVENKTHKVASNRVPLSSRARRLALNIVCGDGCDVLVDGFVAMAKKASAKSEFRDTKSFWFMVPVLLAASIYIPSSRSDFIHDDHFQIVQNKQVQSWDYFTQLVSTDVWSQKGPEHIGHYYRPVFSVWLLLIYTIGGPLPWVWHLANVILHATATFCVFLFGRTFLKTAEAGFVGSLLFSVHPIHVDAVSWVSASNELLFTVFFLASLLALTRVPGEKQSYWLISSIVLYWLALLSKETALVLLPVFPIAWWLVLKERPNKILHGRIHLFRASQIAGFYSIPITLYLAIRWVVLHGIGVEAGKHRFAQILFSGPGILAFYIRNLDWPVGLAGFYVNPLISSPSIGMCLVATALLLGLVALTWLSRTVSLVFGLTAALITLPLLPALAALRVYDQGNMTHDRYLYLPSVGLCLLLSVGVSYLWPRKRIRPAMLAIFLLILGAMGYLTVRQQTFYRDDQSFYSRAIAVDGRNALVMGYLGDAYLEQRDNEHAMQWFERAVQTAPDDPNAEFYLARGLMKTNAYSTAMPYLQDLGYGAKPISPRRKSAVLLSLANAEIHLNERENAEHTLMDLERFNPTFPGTHRTLGIIYQQEGNIEKAQKEYASEFQISSDPESGQQAVALARRLATEDRGQYR